MNYYFVDTPAEDDRTRIAFGLCDTLSSIGVPVVMATPDGAALQGLRSSASIVPRDRAAAALEDGDAVFFSSAEDHAALRAGPARLAFHCHTLTPDAGPVIRDETVTLLSSRAGTIADIREATGREAFDVGMSINDLFLYDGARKMDRLAACRSSGDRGAVAAAVSKNPHLEFRTIDRQADPERADTLKSAGYCLVADSEGADALLTLEAMAAGCVILTTPSARPSQFLEPGRNCIAAGDTAFAGALRDISSPSNAQRRAALRHAAIVTGRRYRQGAQRRKLEALLEGPFGKCLSWP